MTEEMQGKRETEEKGQKIKKAMNALDLKYLIKELQFLKGARIDAVYQNNNELRIRFYAPNYGNYELFVNPTRVHLTTHKRRKPLTPSNFAMLLRKHMMGKRIEEVNQHKMDRVFELATADKILVIEMFHQGNLILCDGAYNIIQPLHFVRRKDRVIVPKEKYKFPASTEIEDYTSFKRSFQSDDSIVKILSSMGFSEYSNEIMQKAGIDRSGTGGSLAKHEIDKLFDAAEDMLLKKKISALIVYEDDKPVAVVPFEMRIFSTEFGFDTEKYDSFNKALDIYFNEKIKHILEPPITKKEKPRETGQMLGPEDKIKKEKAIIEKQEETIDEYKDGEGEEREEANLIYSNYGLVDNVLTTLRNARSKYSWDEIKNIIEKEDSPEANSIIEIREHENKVVMNIDGQRLELFINKTPEENASYYFEHAKKFKRKAVRAEEEVEKRKNILHELEQEIAPTFTAEEQETEQEVEQEMESGQGIEQKEQTRAEQREEQEQETGQKEQTRLETEQEAEQEMEAESNKETESEAGLEKEIGVESEQKSSESEQKSSESEIEPDFSRKQKKKRGRWYHKYRYFWSLEGLLIVAGKDASTNEELIKKHTEPNDIVLHADIQGAPFVVIKQRRDKREQTEDLTPQGVVEAAEFAASYSKAWQMGLGSVEVYWVKPEQVSKQAEPGQFLPKGSFVIRGQRNYMKSIKLRLAVGADLQNKYFIVAPVKSVASRCDYYVTIQPGAVPANELAETIKNMLIEKALYPDEKDIIQSIPLEQISARIPSAKGSIMDRVESGLL